MKLVRKWPLIRYLRCSVHDHYNRSIEKRQQNTTSSYWPSPFSFKAWWEKNPSFWSFAHMYAGFYMFYMSFHFMANQICMWWRHSHVIVKDLNNNCGNVQLFCGITLHLSYRGLLHLMFRCSSKQTHIHMNFSSALTYQMYLLSCESSALLPTALQTLTHLFAPLLTPFIHSFVCLLTHSLTKSLIFSFIDSPISRWIDSFKMNSFYLLIDWYTHSLARFLLQFCANLCDIF